MAKSNILYLDVKLQSKKPINDAKMSPQMMVDFLDIQSVGPMATRRKRFNSIFNRKISFSKVGEVGIV